MVASGLLVISQTTSLIVLAERTNFTFHKISIRLEIAELDIASYSYLSVFQLLTVSSYYLRMWVDLLRNFCHPVSLHYRTLNYVEPLPNFNFGLILSTNYSLALALGHR